MILFSSVSLFVLFCFILIRVFFGRSSRLTTLSSIRFGSLDINFFSALLDPRCYKPPHRAGIFVISGFGTKFSSYSMICLRFHTVRSSTVILRPSETTIETFIY